MTNPSLEIETSTARTGVHAWRKEKTLSARSIHRSIHPSIGGFMTSRTWLLASIMAAVASKNRVLVKRKPRQRTRRRRRKISCERSSLSSHLEKLAQHSSNFERSDSQCFRQTLVRAHVSPQESRPSFLDSIWLVSMVMFHVCCRLG